MPEPSPYMTLMEAAAFLRLHPRTLDNMRQRGTGPLYTKHGGRVVYHRDDLVAWSNEHRRRTTTEKKPRPPDGPVAAPPPCTQKTETPAEEMMPDT